METNETKITKAAIAQELVNALNSKLERYSQICGCEFKERAYINYVQEDSYSSISVRGGDEVGFILTIAKIAEQLRDKYETTFALSACVNEDGNPEIVILF